MLAGPVELRARGQFLHGVCAVHCELQAGHHAFMAHGLGLPLGMQLTQVDEDSKVGDREQREHDSIRIHVPISSRKTNVRQSVR